MHEHIACADWSMRANFGERFFEPGKMAEIAAAMFTKMKRECGVTTVVDGTPVNLGRDARLIREVAERSGVNFIVSSGFYYQEEPWLMFRPEDEIVELLLEECRNGIADSGILPGIMKCAVGDAGITPLIRKILTAVARVAAQTGLPVFCHHTVSSKNGGEILDIFEKQGVALNRVILGHSGDTDDLAYLEEMLKRGCYIGMDRFGYCDMTLSLERRAAAIAALCEKGYGQRMLLSHDLVAYGAFGGSWDEYKKANPEERYPDFTFIQKSVLPALLAAGVTQAEFDSMMVENPRRFFEGQ
ncbi:MAG: phosphotriesterase [Defluviitaleaceae bacterium]|nr:phosphotriesterase [Defluviitaleaceae bacterium]